ncbi:MAG: BatD family protein [Pseudomonadota bacterium]|nr:BatD family protein [Pseudomonadota bacterium]
MRANRNCVWLIVLISMLLASEALADEQLVYATIQPAQITLGESAKFTITNLGDGASPVSMPVVPGLRFEVIGRTRQIELVNGTTLPSSSIVVRVTPQVAGIFTIPGVTPKTQPLVLQVNPPGSVGAATDSTPKPANPPPILSGASVPKGVHLTDDGSAYLRLTVPKREVYVGEDIPVEMEVGMRSGFVSSLNGLPKLTGDNFTLNNLSRQPERSEKLIEGQPFVLLTWRSSLSVVKPGTFPLVAQVPLTVKIRTRSKRQSELDDQFGDPFWQNFFGMTVPKDITVESPGQELKVSELPAEGRPADFHGAIGTFAIESDISPGKGEVGEPLTLRMRVIGSGNFDRVDSAMLQRIDQWKTYPPKSTFSSYDSVGHKGEKTFEQPIIASKSGVQTIPALSFSYFDPNLRRYQTVHGSALQVTISAAAADSSLAAPAPGESATSPVNEFTEGLKPDHAAGGRLARSLTPLYLQTRFLAVPSLLVLAFSAGCLGVRRRRRSAGRLSGRNRGASRAAKRRLAQMETAARGGNASLFFNSARDALQEILAKRWQVPADQVTTAEVQQRLGHDDIGKIFAFADESKYSGHDLGATDLGRWARVVRREVAVGEAP